jgi:regulator of PEP synthase PpsR (kinase-PPPase family)
MSPATPLVYAVSDATGETAEQACRAALAQFGPVEVARIRLIAHVLDEHAVETAVRQAKENNALLVYTLVGPALRARMKEVAAEHNVTAVDLLGGLIGQLARHLGRAPLSMPGLGHELDAAYFRRVEAIEFAVNNDDGRQPQNLVKADLVIVGLRRTSKTPLSNYIAHRGYRVANVPLVIEVPPPRELDQVDPKRVFGLVIDPFVLSNIRRTRIAALGMSSDSGYGNLQEIRKELTWARRVFDQHPHWTVVDITQKAIEETASLILEMYRARFEPANGPSSGAPAVAPESTGR